MSNSAASADSAVMQEQLVVLKSLKQKTQELVDFKATLLQKTELLDHKQNLLEEIVAERQRLQKERKVLLDMLQAVQRDVDTVKEAEQSLGRERDELQLTVNKIRNEQYETLHGTDDKYAAFRKLVVTLDDLDEVNELRLRCGLPKIPHIQQELEAHMAR
ncbi:uncharacterized protein BYT42DRAFT_609704 [Radiomyces spectabilis]|uniref:uncharacterized protein n=1 Tax=Radiomyces spectabilis TaxID=64574 RepID=UPI00221FA074|nr:uncharacterized protein BYT42DRAFT_609704 [Radiomyces spectabilis]KAI8393942.1 hypothetical protein BYT42DRAFT_609704 [Radiomyces spectabilis]